MYDKLLNEMKGQIAKLLAEKKKNLTVHLRKQPFQQSAEVSTCPAWAIQVFAEYMLNFVKHDQDKTTTEFIKAFEYLLKDLSHLNEHKNGQHQGIEENIHMCKEALTNFQLRPAEKCDAVEFLKWIKKAGFSTNEGSPDYFHTDFPNAISIHWNKFYTEEELYVMFKQGKKINTGKKDKNGKEIFEGSIMKYTSGIGTIVFDRGAWGMWITEAALDSTESDGLKKSFVTNHSDWEVIG